LKIGAPHHEMKRVSFIKLKLESTHIVKKDIKIPAAVGLNTGKPLYLISRLDKKVAITVKPIKKNEFVG
jgi:hypothetical protein